MNKIIIILAITILVSVLSSCTDSVANSNVVVENDLNGKSSIWMTAGQIGILNLEGAGFDLAEYPGEDTGGEAGKDHVTYYIDETGDYEFCFDDDYDNPHRMVLEHPDGTAHVDIRATGECTLVTLEAGEYEMKLYHGGDLYDATSDPIIIRSDTSTQLYEVSSVTNTYNKASNATIQKLTLGKSCIGCDLRYSQFYNLNLKGIILTNADLRQTDFDTCNLSFAHLENARLRNAYIYGSDFSHANMDGVDLTYTHWWAWDGDVHYSTYPVFYATSLRNTIMNYLDFSGINMEYADLTGADMTEVNFDGANLKGAKVDGATLKDIDLSASGIDLIGMDLSHQDLSNVNLSGLDMSRADFSHATLTGATLDGTILIGAKFPHADLTGAHLTYAILTDVDDPTDVENINSADFSGADMTGAHLSNAHMIHATLQGTIFENAQLDNVNLWHADLTGADLTGANLSGSKLKQANFTNAILTGANLSGVTYMDSAVFDGATWIDGSVCAAGSTGVCL